MSKGLDGRPIWECDLKNEDISRLEKVNLIPGNLGVAQLKMISATGAVHLSSPLTKRSGKMSGAKSVGHEEPDNRRR